MGEVLKMPVRRALPLVAIMAVTLSASAGSTLASTLPGSDGQIATAAFRARSATIGIATPRHALRTVFSTSLSIFLSNLSFSPDGRRIAYEDFSGGPGSSLAILNLDSREVEPIGAHGLQVSNPAFLSNGKIVFAGTKAQGRHPGTYEIDANGAHMHRLFGSQELAASADGRWFVKPNRRASALLLLNRRGRELRQLTTDPDFRYLRATFSPDGRWIAYTRRIEPQGRDLRSDIFIVRRDGTKRRRLTFGGDASDPVFSPSGKWIAYAHFHSGFGGNLAMIEVRHPAVHKAITKVRRARFQSPAWARR